MTKSRARGQPAVVDSSRKQASVQRIPQESTEPELDGAVIISNHVSTSTEFNFDDEFFSQDQVSKPKLIRSQKHQALHEHARNTLDKVLVGYTCYPVL